MVDAQPVADTQEITTQPELTLDEKRNRTEAINTTLKDLKSQQGYVITIVPCTHCNAEVGEHCTTRQRQQTKAHNDRRTAWDAHNQQIRDAIREAEAERRALQEDVATAERQIKRAGILQAFLDTCTSKTELLVSEASDDGYRVVRTTNTLELRVGYTLEKHEVQQVIDAGITVHVEAEADKRGYPMMAMPPWAMRW